MLAIVERDLADAAGEISADWRFGIAYNAALKLCAILLHASGFRPEKNLAHYRTLAALPLILGPDRQPDAAYLETCRTKRNIVEYDRAGAATGEEAVELAAFASELKSHVLEWLLLTLDAASSVKSRPLGCFRGSRHGIRWLYGHGGGLDENLRAVVHIPELRTRIREGREASRASALRGRPGTGRRRGQSVAVRVVQRRALCFGIGTRRGQGEDRHQR
jgi:hypothetical protein